MATRAINYLLFLILCFLLISSVTESFKKLGAEGVPPCTSAGMVASGDTCKAITTALPMEPEKFHALNPNLDCDKLFVGQWVCTRGEVNKIPQSQWK